MNVTAMPKPTATHAEQDKRGDVRVTFIPYTNAMPNPYLRELAAHLGEIGVQVVGQVTPKGLLWDVLRRPGPKSLIHLHWLPSFGSSVRHRLHAMLWVARLRALRWLGCKIVWTVHNLYNHEVESKSTDRWIAQRIIALATKVIVHSKIARRLVTEEFDAADSSKVVVVPHANYVGSYSNTINRTDARSKLGVKKEAFVCLFLGSIRPYKGVIELISAYRNMGMPDTCLFVAGEPMNASFSSKIEEAAGTDRSVQLRLGLIPDDDIQIYMSACDVVVFPYREILTSGAVVLAMSFGRPCIAPNLGCIPDILDDEGAFLYDPENEDGLQESLRRAIQSRAKLESMGNHNLERAKDWDWEKVALQTARCYDTKY